MRYLLPLVLLLAAQVARADVAHDDYWPSSDYAVAAVHLQGFYGNCWGAAINQYGDLAAFCSWTGDVTRVGLAIYSGPTSWDQRLLGAPIGGYGTIEQYIQVEITPAGDFDIWAGLATLTYRETVIVDHNRTALGPGQIAGVYLGRSSWPPPLPQIFDDYGWDGWVGYVATPIPPPVPEPSTLVLFASAIIVAVSLRVADLRR